MQQNLATIEPAIAQTGSTATFDVYHGASLHSFGDHVRDILEQPPNPTIIDIRADGLIYIPQTYYRRILNHAFGPGKWALLQYNVLVDGNSMYYDGVLYIEGKFVARAMGEANMIDSNRNMTWATVYESAKSDCLTRVCKDLGVYGDLWSPMFVERWIDEYAVKVWRRNWPKDGQHKAYWRRKDRKPYWFESEDITQPKTAPKTAPKITQSNTAPKTAPKTTQTKTAPKTAPKTVKNGKVIQPPVSDYADNIGEYPILIGKYEGKTLKDVGLKQLGEYQDFLAKKNLHPNLIQAIETFITGLPF